MSQSDVYDFLPEEPLICPLFLWPILSVAKIFQYKLQVYYQTTNYLLMFSFQMLVLSNNVEFIQLWSFWHKFGSYCFLFESYKQYENNSKNFSWLNNTSFFDWWYYLLCRYLLLHSGGIEMQKWAVGCSFFHLYAWRGDRPFMYHAPVSCEVHL
jgi:hypothetical protein